MVASLWLFPVSGLLPLFLNTEEQLMKTLEEIQAHLDATVNTLLGQHRSSVSVHSRGDDHVNIVMVGGCRGCAGAKYTLSMLIKKSIQEFDPTVLYINDYTDHTDKSSAFFKE